MIKEIKVNVLQDLYTIPQNNFQNPIQNAKNLFLEQFINSVVDYFYK